MGKKMKAIDHKNVYQDGKNYDAMNSFNWDFPFYKKYALECKGSVLELACGTGRLTIPLATEGIDITGIDISEGMIKEAEIKAKDLNVAIDFQVQDIRTFKIDKKFQFIFLPYNSICHIHDFESIKSLFQSVKKHLAPNGVFIVDVFKPSLAHLTRKKDEVFTNNSYKISSDKNIINHTETSFYNQADQVNYIEWFLEQNGKIENQKLNMRMFFPQELDNYLQFSGFEIIDKFGDHFENKFDNDANWQIVVCKVQQKV